MSFLPGIKSSQVLCFITDSGPSLESQILFLVLCPRAPLEWLLIKMGMFNHYLPAALLMSALQLTTSSCGRLDTSFGILF